MLNYFTERAIEDGGWQELGWGEAKTTIFPYD